MLAHVDVVVCQVPDKVEAQAEQSNLSVQVQVDLAVPPAMLVYQVEVEVVAVQLHSD